MKDFRDRVALITGAASGIGRQLALSLAAAGARVAALDRDRAGLDRLLADLGGRPAAAAAADVTDLAAVRAAARDLEARVGPTDLLFACAGVGMATPAETFRAEDVNAILGVNLVGVVNSVDAVLAGMRERRRGHLVVLSSLASCRGLPFMAGYCASKAAVNALFDSLRVELPPFGVRVTTVCPSWVRTPLTAPLPLPPGELMGVERAVDRILAAVRREQAVVAFPPLVALQAGVLRRLPRGLSDWLTRLLLAKARRMTGG